MKWLKRKLRKWLSEEEYAVEMGAKIASASHDYEEGNIRFVLSPAVGGRILRVTRETFINKASNSIGSSRDNETTTYVIPAGEDVGQRVTKILNLELLK